MAWIDGHPTMFFFAISTEHNDIFIQGCVWTIVTDISPWTFSLPDIPLTQTINITITLTLTLNTNPTNLTKGQTY